MNVETPAGKRRARRLAAIRDAALQLVVEDGLENFSVHKLADRVDLTAGALYRYYESRDEMLLAVELEVRSFFEAYFNAALAALVGAPILEQLVFALRGYAALAELQPQRFALHALGFHPWALASSDGMLQRLSELIEQAMREGQLREPGDAMRRAVVGWSSVHGLVQHPGTRATGDPPDGTRATGDPPNGTRANEHAPDAAADALGKESLLDELLLTLLVGWGASLRAAQIVVDAAAPVDLYQAALQVAHSSRDEEE